LSQRLRLVATLFLLFACAAALSGCSFVREQQIPTVIVAIPTNTLAPIFTQTQKFTATPIPSVTPTPSPSLPPSPTQVAAVPTDQPTPTATAAVLGSVNFTSPTANLRSGPGQSFPVITGVKAGTRVFVLGFNDKKDWYNVRLEEDGREGWLSAPLVTVGSTTIPVLSTADFQQRTKEAQQPVAAASSGTLSPDAAATPRKSPVRQRTDVLAYCDSKTNGEPRRTFTKDTPVTIYWWWFAKTPEQLADHISYAEYTVTVDGKTLTNWRTFQTNVVRQSDGTFAVYWFIPIGAAAVGDHKIDYKLTWKQKITDGYGTFGPGGDEEVNIGSCVFTIK
jgi:uncharacterized protein YraI